MQSIKLLLAFILCFSFFQMKAQDTTVVKGIVLNGAGHPLVNISIAVEGSADLPVLTNENGEFSVISTSPDDKIMITPSSGYKSKAMNLFGRDFVRAFLTPTDLASGEDEMIILGKPVLKKNTSSAFTDLDVSDINKTSALSIDQFMQGRIAGLHSVNISSQPGSGAVTLLRGMRSVNMNAQPLYVVDGVPVLSHMVFESKTDGISYNPLLGINTFDISKVTVLKDPAYTSTYGSKASNGLILIETLNPSSIETSIELDLRTGFSLKPQGLIPQLNGSQHKTLIAEMLISSGLLEENIRELYPVLFLEPTSNRFIDYQHNTNWQENIFRDAGFSNINLTVKGGDQIARYGLSFGYSSNDGIISNTDYKRYNLRFVGLINIFSWLKVNSDVAINNNTMNSKESARILETSPIMTALAKSPLLNPFKYDPDGNEINEIQAVDELGVSNPVAIINNYISSNKNNQFNYGLNLEGKILRNLVLNSKLGLSYNILKENVFMPNLGMTKYYEQEAHNVAVANTNTYNAFYNNTNLGFFSELNKKHKFSLNSGLNILSSKYQNDWGLTKNAPLNDQYQRLQDGTNNLREIGGQNRNWTWLSIYEHLSYSFKDKYLFNAGINLDGSSRLGDNAINTIKLGNVPFGLFYSGSLAWLISEEAFLRDFSWLDELKIRTTYGKTGNEDFNETYTSRNYNLIRYRQTSGLYPSIYNDKLTYETVTEYNAGIDIALLGYRFSFHLDAYRAVTENMLVYSPLDPYLGYHFRPENNGSMENVGYDFSSFLRIIDNTSFKWDINANLSGLKNKILDIENNKLITPIHGGEVVNMKGQKANSFYGYIFKGVYSTSEEAANANLLNNKGVLYQPGDAIYADLSGPDGSPDGIINEHDKTIIGSSLPELFGGINNTFTFKRWSLSTFFQFVSGNDVFNYVRYKNERLTGLENQSVKVLNRWQYEGQITDVPKASWNDPVGNTFFSDRWIEDGSYIRLKNLTLQYAIPQKFLAFRNALFYISANNLLTFSRYLGYDPELAFSYSTLGQGVDYGMAPQTRSFIIGINLGL